MFARLCRNRDIRYKAVERSPQFCQSLRDEGVDVVQASVPPLPFKDEQFDVVCAFAVLEHMPTFEQGLQLLVESHRVLKKDGWLVILVPDYLRAGIDFLHWDYTHSFFMTPLRLQQIVGDSGFDVQFEQHFSGSFVSPWLRWPIDLVGFIVHSRFVYWLGYALKLHKFLEKFHKTFEPSIVMIARKTEPDGKAH